MTAKAIETVFSSIKNISFEIILVDNNSADGSSDFFLKKYKDNKKIKLISNNKNFGFAKAVNQGLKISQGEFIFLLNSDVLIKPKGVERMLDYMDKNKKVGVLGPKFFYPDEKLQLSFGRFPGFLNEFCRLFWLYKILPIGTISGNNFFNKSKFNKIGQVDWVTGGCMLIRREAIDKIGLFDEKYFLGGEDMDFCCRAKKAGWQVVYYPEARVIHYHGFSSGHGGTQAIKRLEFDRAGLLYFMKKHHPNRFFRRNFVDLMHILKIKIITAKNIFFRQNISRYKAESATIAITYNCNSRCRMCNIWQIKNSPELSLAAFSNLSSDLKYINITGGEPFLHKDLLEIIKVINKTCPRANIIISSNGYASDLIIRQMKKILEIDKRVGVRISIDGLSDTHNKIRGVPNIFNQAMGTIGGLRKIGLVNLGLSFTIMDENIKELPEVYELARKNNLEFALALVQNSNIYFQKNSNKINFLEEVRENLNYAIKSELKSWSPKRWSRAFYNYGLKFYAEKGERLLPSGAGFDSLFIDPAGDIYPSNLINLEIGNLADDKLDNIWNSQRVNQVRAEIKNKNIKESWIICTLRGEMKKNFIKVIVWIAKNKLKYIFKI